MRPRSPSGLRPPYDCAAVLGAQGFVARAPAMTRCWLPDDRTRRLRLLGTRCARRPWSPALLAAPEIAQQEPPPTPLNGTSLGWGEYKKVRSRRRARPPFTARERGALSHAAARRARTCGHARMCAAACARGRTRMRGRLRRQLGDEPSVCRQEPTARLHREGSGPSFVRVVASSAAATPHRGRRPGLTPIRELAQRRHVPDGPARLRERTPLSSHQPSEVSASGVAGVAGSRFR
jgi:hypothetical protein